MAKRVLAAVGAVAMVLVAIVIRSAIDDDGGSDEPSDTSETVLVCATDLADLCEGIDDVTVVTEDAADTAAALESGTLPPGTDGWLTTEAWTEVVDVRAPSAMERAAALATSPSQVAVDPNRASAVEALCAGRPLWRCLGDETGADWGDLGGDARWGALKVGLPDARSAVGLSVLATVASGYFDGTDFASNDFETTGFRAWLDTLAEPSGTGEDDPVGTLVTTRGKYTAVGTVAADAAGRVVGVLGPTPSLAATVVLVELRGGGSLPDPEPIRAALAEAGWSPASGTPATTLKPGVMAALLTLWTEVTR